MPFAPTFRQKFKLSDIPKYINSKNEALEKRIVQILIEVGKLAASEAIRTREYTDRTYNLKSSTGFAVFKDGELIHEEYDGTPEGEAEGKRLAKFLGNSHEGYVLAVTAGMFYGVYLEAKGRNVLIGGAVAGSNAIKKKISELQKLMRKRK